MKKELDDLITNYVDVAAHLFPRVAKHLGVSIPIKNIEWALTSVPQRGNTPDGIDFSKHGYGVIMADGTRCVDLDLGEKGEINGFDSWRLFHFAERNKIEIPYSSHAEIDAALREAVSSGELSRRGRLFFRT